MEFVHSFLATIRVRSGRRTISRAVRGGHAATGPLANSLVQDCNAITGAADSICGGNAAVEVFGESRASVVGHAEGHEDTRWYTSLLEHTGLELTDRIRIRASGTIPPLEEASAQTES